MPLAAGAFLAGLVPVGLDPGGVAGSAGDPAGVVKGEEEAGAGVVAWVAVEGG